MLKAALIAIVLLAIVALIVSAANDYREGKIRIRFDEDDHICEHCGNQINIEHPCYCHNCWNGFVAKDKKECDHKDGELSVFDEDNILRIICVHCGHRLK